MKHVYVYRWSWYDADSGDRADNELDPGTVWTNREQIQQLIERETHEEWREMVADEDDLPEDERTPEPVPEWTHGLDERGDAQEFWEWDIDGAIVHRIYKVKLQGEV